MTNNEDEKVKKPQTENVQPQLEQQAVEAQNQANAQQQTANLEQQAQRVQQANLARPEQTQNDLVQPSWQESRDKNISSMGVPIPQDVVKLGIYAEPYTPEKADAARRYNNQIVQPAEKGNFVPDYLTSLNQKQTPFASTALAVPSSISESIINSQKELAQKQALNANAITASNQANMQIFRDSISGKRSPDVFNQIASPLSQQSANTQQIQNGQMTTQSFAPKPEFKDAYGNTLNSARVIYGDGGDGARADYEYKANMNFIKDLARQAASPEIRNHTQEIAGYTEPQIVKRGMKAALVGGGQPIYQMVPPAGESAASNAAKALAAFGGAGAVGTYSGLLKNTADARHTNVSSDLAPGLAQSTINSQGASANKTNVEAQLMPENAASDRKYKEAATAKYNADTERDDLITRWGNSQLSSPPAITTSFEPTRKKIERINKYK